MAIKIPSYSPGTLVQARGRNWVVLPANEDNVVRLRPVDGSDAAIREGCVYESTEFHLGNIGVLVSSSGLSSGVVSGMHSASTHAYVNPYRHVYANPYRHAYTDACAHPHTDTHAYPYTDTHPGAQGLESGGGNRALGGL